MRFSALGAMAALLPAQDEAPALGVRVERALQDARPALRQHLIGQRADVLALVCFALLHDGVGGDDAELHAAFDRLARVELVETYGLSLRLMVMAHAPEFPDRERLVRADTARLLDNQRASGGFGYRPHTDWWDLSNTQYAALGLRAAESLRQPIADSRWLGLMRAASAAQVRDGGFTYRAKDYYREGTASMTAAGILVLELVRRHVELGHRDRRLVEQRLQRAWRWLDRHADAIGSAATPACLYFHYGLERCGILADVARVGDADWYARGAEMVLGMQGGGGGFFSESEPYRTAPRHAELGDPVDTAFAVLFLRRNFKKLLPVTGPPSYFSATLPAGADEASVAAAAARDVARGHEAVPSLLEALRSDVVTRRIAATRALRLIAGEDFGIAPLRPPAANREALARAARWWASEGDGR